MRWFSGLLCIVLAGCSMPVEDLSQPPSYVPPSPPSAAAQTKGLKMAIAVEKLVGTVQISDVRVADNGPGPYVICIAGRRADGGEVGYYAAFFQNEDYKDVRPAVIYDFCEKQAYRPRS